jgi:GTP cyclohydrolase III
MQKTILTILGVVFLAIGVLGFVSDPLLGIFEVDTLHNIIHILSGALALVAVSMGANAMNTFSRIFGVVYGIVAVLGFVSGDNVLGLIMVNAADNVLHLVLAVIFLYLGFGQSKGASSSM